MDASVPVIHRRLASGSLKYSSDVSAPLKWCNSISPVSDFFVSGSGWPPPPLSGELMVICFARFVLEDTLFIIKHIAPNAHPRAVKMTLTTTIVDRKCVRVHIRRVYTMMLSGSDSCVLFWWRVNVVVTLHCGQCYADNTVVASCSYHRIAMFSHLQSASSRICRHQWRIWSAVVFDSVTETKTLSVCPKMPTCKIHVIGYDGIL